MTTATATPRIGVVSFVNTLPLIDGLEDLADVEVRQSVPSLLVDQLLDGEVDISLCSTIDYQTAREPLVIVPVGILGCAGPTLTVRLYAQRPIEELDRVYCDTDSHTSVVLLRILLAERFGIRPEIVDYDAREHVAENRPLPWPEAMLLIGDKVVTDSPPAIRYPIQLDLGDTWHTLTRLPFVFATWMARRDRVGPDLVTAARILDRQRRYNRERIDRMIHDTIEPRGWPADLAATYLKQRLRFEWTNAAREGLELFYAKAMDHGLIESVREIEVMEW